MVIWIHPDWLLAHPNGTICISPWVVSDGQSAVQGIVIGIDFDSMLKPVYGFLDLVEFEVSRT